MKTTRRGFLGGLLLAAAALAVVPVKYVARKLGWVNVKDYGAIGDGVADDRAAFVRALNVVDYGGTVYVPPGVYTLDSSRVRDSATDSTPAPSPSDKQ